MYVMKMFVKMTYFFQFIDEQTTTPSRHTVSAVCQELPSLLYLRDSWEGWWVYPAPFCITILFTNVLLPKNTWKYRNLENVGPLENGLHAIDFKQMGNIHFDTF